MHQYFLDGLYVYGGVEHIDVVCDKFIIGGSTIYGKNNTLEGSVKWLRTYDRVLSQVEVSNLAKEFDNCPGDGKSWTRAMGSMPDTIEDDTAYIIRRYEDDTSTYEYKHIQCVKGWILFSSIFCFINKQSSSKNSIVMSGWIVKKVL